MLNIVDKAYTFASGFHRSNVINGHLSYTSDHINRIVSGRTKHKGVEYQGLLAIGWLHRILNGFSFEDPIYQDRLFSIKKTFGPYIADLTQAVARPEDRFLSAHSEEDKIFMMHKIRHFGDVAVIVFLADIIAEYDEHGARLSGFLTPEDYKKFKSVLYKPSDQLKRWWRLTDKLYLGYEETYGEEATVGPAQIQVPHAVIPTSIPSFTYTFGNSYGSSPGTTTASSIADEWFPVQIALNTNEE